MRIAVWSVSAVMFLCAVAVTCSQESIGPVITETAWGDIVNGLQLGLAPQTGTNASARELFDGTNIYLQVFLRNTGQAPVKLLASVHTCLLGEDGENALCVSKFVMQPKAGGDPLTVTYKGWNHLSLLDKRRSKSEQPQQTLNDSFGHTDIQLSSDDAKRMTTVLAPGEIRLEQIEFSTSKSTFSWWQLEKPATVPAGTYAVTAVLNVDQEMSEWKGELRSSQLTVGIPKK